MGCPELDDDQFWLLRKLGLGELKLKRWHLMKNDESFQERMLRLGLRRHRGDNEVWVFRFSTHTVLISEGFLRNVGDSEIVWAIARNIYEIAYYRGLHSTNEEMSGLDGFITGDVRKGKPKPPDGVLKESDLRETFDDIFGRDSSTKGMSDDLRDELEDILNKDDDAG